MFMFVMGFFLSLFFHLSSLCKVHLTAKNVVIRKSMSLKNIPINDIKKNHMKLKQKYLKF